MEGFDGIIHSYFLNWSVLQKTLSADTYHTSNANSAKITFWPLLNVIDNPSILHSLREELAPPISGMQINIKHLLENCPLTDAVFNEILRLATGVTSARNVDASTIVAGKTLVACAKIIISYRQLHYDEAVFGPAVRAFKILLAFLIIKIFAIVRPSSLLGAEQPIALGGLSRKGRWSLWLLS